MGTEEFLAEIEGADMVLVGLGEDFDDVRRLKDYPGYLKGRELLQESGCRWLVPAWNEFCSGRMEDIVSPALKKLAGMLEGKNYFVIATATDRRVAEAPWKKDRLVMPCGTAGRKQCAGDPEHATERLTEAERGEMNSFFEKLLAGSLPAGGTVELAGCGQCGAGMVLNNIFAESYNEHDYLEQWQHYIKWLQGTLNRRLLVLELGVGMRFPSVIRWPFEKAAFFNRKAAFIRVNETLYQMTEELAGKGSGIPKNAIAWLERL